MATFKPAPKSVVEMAQSILRQFDTHQPLIDAGVKIDFLMAYPRYDEKDRPVGNALQKNGVKALGVTRKISLSDRTKGHGDAEIKVDGEWWENEASEPEQRALLDHELHHISVIVNKAGVLKTDDLGRPQIRLRKHDVEVGWFATIAQRHGAHSQERIQAARIMDACGQFFWPGLVSSAEGRTARLEMHALAK